MEVSDKAAPVGEREAFEDKYPAAKKLGFSGGVYLNRLGSELPRSVCDGINDAWVDFQAGAAYQRAQQATDWQPSGADYDHSIHTNPDAKAWADLFVATFPGLADKHELMIAWFANAMMAMHDHLKAQQPQSAEAVAYVLTRDGEVCYEADDGIVISNTPGDETDLYKWQPVYFTTPQPSAGVVMPDVSAMAKVLSDRSADACNIDRGDNWAMYGQEYIDDVEAMLSAARLNGKEVGRG